MAPRCCRILASTGQTSLGGRSDAVPPGMPGGGSAADGLFPLDVLERDFALRVLSILNHVACPIERRSPLKVLIVDDSAMSRKMVMKALPPGFEAEISQAANGEEALAAYHAGNAEVIFLDLTMPVMDGFRALEPLKREDANAVVIVISADIQP